MCEDAQGPMSQEMSEESSETEVTDKTSRQCFQFQLRTQVSFISIAWNLFWHKLHIIYATRYLNFSLHIKTYIFLQIQASAHDNGHEITIAQQVRFYKKLLY